MIVRMDMVRRWTVVAAACAVMGATAVHGDADEAAPDAVPIGRVLSQLKTEAQAQWKEDLTFPRQASDFAQESGVTVDHAAVITALQRRVNLQAPIDAYIKWQLLSFDVDLSHLDDKELRRIVVRMPRMKRPPKPRLSGVQRSQAGGGMGFQMGAQMPLQSGRSRPGQQGAVKSVRKVGDKTIVERRPLPETQSGFSMGSSSSGSTRTTDPRRAVERANQRLQNDRKEYEATNRIIVTYRDALLDRLPMHASMRLDVMLDDLDERIRAGDRSFSDSYNRFIGEVERRQSTDPMPDERRVMLARRLYRIGRRHTTVVQSVSIDASGRIVQRGASIRLGNQAALRGLGALTVEAHQLQVESNLP